MRQFGVLGFLGLLALASLNPTLSFAETGKDKKDAKNKEGAAAESSAASEAPSTTSFTCESNVYYTWKRLPPPEPANSSGKDKSAKKEKKEKPEIVQPDEAFFTKISHTAPTQAEGEFQLRGKFAHAQSAARQECERLHQNLSGCLVNTMRTAREDYQVFDFELRRKYIDAMQQDCVQDSGVCVSTRAGEISCHEDIIPGAKSAKGESNNEQTANGKSADAAAAKDSGKKDSKKK